MKSNRKLALAVLIGMAIGIAGATAIHARQMKMAPGYVIAEVDVTDFGTLAGNSDGTFIYDAKRTELIDNLSWTHGMHSVKFGVDVNYTPERQQREKYYGGLYEFNTLALPIYTTTPAHLTSVTASGITTSSATLVWSTDIATTGHTSAASVPLALSRLVDSGEVASGGLALLLAFGAGLTYAGQVIRIP